MTQICSALDHCSDEFRHLQPAEFWIRPWRDLMWRRPYGTFLASDDVWKLAPDLVPRTSEYKRTITFREALPEGIDVQSPGAGAMIVRLKRLALVLLACSGPNWPGRPTKKHKGDKTGAGMKPITWVARVQEIIRLAREILEAQLEDSISGTCPDGVRIFTALRPHKCGSKINVSRVAHIHGRMEDLLAVGVLDDWLAFRPKSPRAIAKAGSFGRAVKLNSTQPYDDKMLADMLKAALFFSTASLDIAGLMGRAASLACHYDAKDDRADYLRQALSEYTFRYLSDGTFGEYAVARSGQGTIGSLKTLKDWPLVGLRTVYRSVQACNAALISFSLGCRKEELDYLPRDAVEWKQGVAIISARAFKCIQSFNGAPREWPLPLVAVKAIERQTALAESVDRGGAMLFVSPSPNDRRRNSDWRVSGDLKRCIHNIVRADGSPIFPRTEAVNVTRMRTSTARLVAIALQGGLNVVRVVYGHDNVMQTAGYAHARRDFSSELHTAMKRAERALGREVFEEFFRGELPSRTHDVVQAHLDASQRVKAEVLTHLGLPRDGRAALDSDDLDKAAETFADGIQRSTCGVLCFNRGHADAPCSGNWGRPDPSACATGCDHRFELALALHDRVMRAESALRKLAELVPDDPGTFLIRHGRRIELLEALEVHEGPVARFLRDERVHAVVESIDTPTIAQLPAHLQAVISVIRATRLEEADA